MTKIAKIQITANATIKEALQIIDSGSLQIAIVVDEHKKLLGTLTDGDVRRGILNGLALNDTIDTIYYRTPLVAKVSDTKEDILKLALSRKLHQIPIVDDDRNVVGLQEIQELLSPSMKTNQVVLMVGGLGTRLRPLTEKTPKPMLKVGDKPILQTIIEQFIGYGYVNITMCVNYKSDIIQDYFGDGSQFGAKIQYVLETKKMGTAGALSLLSELPNEPFFVMNGDLLTNINFEYLHDYHLGNDAFGTMCVREYDFKIPYGVVNLDDGKIVSIEEKPVQKVFVNAGIYMLSPQALECLPRNEFYDMPTLFQKLIEKKAKTISFPIREYWLDIGRIEEYQKANEEYGEIF